VSLPIVRGFRFAGIPAGIKKKAGARDLALVVADAPCTTAAVLTKNLVRAAPVEITRERVRSGKAQAVLVNAGCANACTGKAGERAALDSTRAVAAALGIHDASVLPASTGVIGVVLPGEKIVAHADALVRDLSDDGAARFAEAIMTTDQGPKTSSRTITVGKETVTVLGIAKGAGMIHPNMATTLGFVLTDARIGRAFAKKTLREATALTFNCISVDGDTSTNDTIVLMASGASGKKKLEDTPKHAKLFANAVREVLEDLGRLIVADGEGAEHLVRIDVTGASSDLAARKVAATIATSPLVKTAIHGCDPNWGRIVAAAGRAGVKFDPDAVRVQIGDVVVFDRGLPFGDAETDKRASDTMSAAEYVITVALGKGRGRAHYDTCDFGHAYINVNADYRS
jgi:glutamate N-acetyltransferase/amino-acid N-acetyltransferase